MEIATELGFSTLVPGSQKVSSHSSHFICAVIYKTMGDVDDKIPNSER